MYCRVVHVKAVSEIQLKMITSYIESTMMPRNLAAGQVSGEVFETSPTEIFTVSKFSDEETANKIMGLMKDQIHYRTRREKRNRLVIYKLLANSIHKYYLK